MRALVEEFIKGETLNKTDNHVLPLLMQTFNQYHGHNMVENLSPLTTEYFTNGEINQINNYLMEFDFEEYKWLLEVSEYGPLVNSRKAHAHGVTYEVYVILSKQMHTLYMLKYA